MPNGERERFEVLLEEVRSGIKLIAEGHQTLNDKVDGIAEGHRTLNDKVDEIALDFTMLKKDIRIVKDHLGLNGATPPAKARKTSGKK